MNIEIRCDFGFGYSEIHELGQVLKQWAEYPSKLGYPEDVTISVDDNGMVFLVDNDTYNIYAINPLTDKLERFYSLSGTGREDFLFTLVQDYQNGYIMNDEDIQDLKDICDIEGISLEVAVDIA